MSNQLGVIGMGVMGLNLALNAAEKGIRVSVYNRTASRMTSAVERAKRESLRLDGFESMKDFVRSLEKPRKIILLVQAGAAVDATLEALMGLVEKDDILIDGGNEFYANTERRMEAAAKKGIHFVGLGISGGEEGARHGPALMPGGSRETYEELKGLLEKIAAQSKSGPCVRFMGNRSAGNYVKMVHNGIEYGDMQLISECYEVLRRVKRFSNSRLSEVFAEFNKGRMNSYLVQITSIVLATKHPRCEGAFLVDDVLDVAASKGTGKWTAQEACEKGVPCPTIQAALEARYISGMEEVRAKARELLAEGEAASSSAEELAVEDVETALFLSKLCSYAQGLMLIAAASKEHNYGVDIKDVAACWTAGCIIRASLLQDIMEHYESGTPNLILLPAFSRHFTAEAVQSWRAVVSAAFQRGIPIPAMAASLNYFTALRASSLPANLIQAQRDLFGAHTFRLKSDPQGVYHADWESGQFTDAP